MLLCYAALTNQNKFPLVICPRGPCFLTVWQRRSESECPKRTRWKQDQQLWPSFRSHRCCFLCGHRPAQIQEEGTLTHLLMGWWSMSRCQESTQNKKSCCDHLGNHNMPYQAGNFRDWRWCHQPRQRLQEEEEKGWGALDDEVRCEQVRLVKPVNL